MSRTTLLIFTTVAVLVGLAGATRVNECNSDKAMKDTDKVQITNCDAPPCKLKKRTKIGIELKFTPEEDIQNLTTNVHAVLYSISLPFIGVDGTDACGKIFTIADKKPAGCPLKKGVEYVYKNEFPILAIYPNVPLTVHWALKSTNKTVTCFEVQSRID